MTTFFTVLILSYAVQGEELQMRLVYENEIECSVAIASVEQIMPEDRILAVTCARSNLISAAPRPPVRG